MGLVVDELRKKLDLRPLRSASSSQTPTVRFEIMLELTIGQSALLTDMALCVNRYRLFTPGIYVCIHAPVLLDAEHRIVPGLVAMVNHGSQKQCQATSKEFQGPPNFVLDVFAHGQTSEYERRRDLFGRFGVTEYVTLEDRDAPVLRWNRNDNGTFRLLEPDQNGLIKSEALPGFWLSTRALADRDWWSLLAVIERGTTRRGHHEFQETVWHIDGRTESGEPIPFEAG